MNVQKIFQTTATLTMTTLVMLLLMLPGNANAVTQHAEILTTADWPEYENGTNILALPQVVSILEKFEEQREISIEIRYPGGDSGRMWAESMLSWLVSFGIPLSYLELFPGSGGPDRLTLTIINRSQ